MTEMPLKISNTSFVSQKLFHVILGLGSTYFSVTTDFIRCADTFRSTIAYIYIYIYGPNEFLTTQTVL